MIQSKCFPSIGFPKSLKENEFRRALTPMTALSLKHPENLVLEFGYGDCLGFSDDDYRANGVRFGNREEVLSQPIICDPKIGDAEYLPALANQTVFGWVHAVQNRDIADCLINGKLTAFAWEEMFAGGRHTFYKNNELAGEAAVLHAFQCYGDIPYGMNVALLGRGNVATGAVRALNMLGASVTQYGKSQEELFQKELCQFDVIVNAILWDPTRNDHIVYRKDLKKLKKGALIIDVSCDRAGGIETSVPTTIEDPIYVEEGIVHYVVDHTPALYYRTASRDISEACAPFFDELIEGNYSDCLTACEIVHCGTVVDRRINEVQGR